MQMAPILISLKTAAWAVLITFVLGILLAWCVVRIRNRAVRIIMDGVLTLPLVLPPTVAGFLLLYRSLFPGELLF